jgi:hypothetical protein
LCDGLRAIDVDFHDPCTARALMTLLDLRFAPTIIRTRRNSGKFLAVYRARDGQPKKRTLVAAGDSGKIEVLGLGQQFVAFGRHETGVDLEWLTGSPLVSCAADLPALSEDDVTAFFAVARKIIGEARETSTAGAKAHDESLFDSPTSSHGLTADLADVVAALAVIPNDGPTDWEHWNRIGVAAWAATEFQRGNLSTTWTAAACRFTPYPRR